MTNSDIEVRYLGGYVKSSQIEFEVLLDLLKNPALNQKDIDKMKLSLDGRIAHLKNSLDKLKAIMSQTEAGSPEIRRI